MSKLDNVASSLDTLYSKYKTAEPKDPTKARLLNPFPSFDRYLGGGPGKGKITTFAGLFSVGKTSLALQFAGYNKDEVVGFLDCEYEWTEASYKWVEQYFGIERERIIVMQPEFIEEAGNMVYDLCDHTDIVVHDGLTSIGSKAEYDDALEANKMGQDARTLNKFFRKFRGKINRTETAVIATNKLYQNIGNQFEPIVEPGGGGVSYYPSQKLWITLSNNKDKEKKVVGQNLNITVRKDKLSGNRGKKFSIIYHNGIGFDVERDIITNAVDFGIISRGGAWYTYDKTKVQGEAAVVELLLDNPELKKEIRERVSEAIINERKTNEDAEESSSEE